VSDASGKGGRPRGAAYKPLSRPLIVFLRDGLKVNFPPRGFDPRAASDDQLRQYFLPPRPDRAVAERAYENWLRAMSGPPVWLTMPPRGDGLDAKFLRALFAVSPARSERRLSGVPSQEASGNWSGAYVRPRDFSPMSLVQGFWNVPNPDPPPGRQAGTYVSSAWVGLDGHDPATRSLPQIGTEQKVTVQVLSAPDRKLCAWWQWWVHDAPHSGRIVIKSLRVNAGDPIYAQVQKIDDVTASLFIINLQSNLAFPAWFKVVQPGPAPNPGPNPLIPYIEGRTAEWVVERPGVIDSDEIYQLPNYGELTFSGCNAGAGPPLGPVDVDLSRARLIRMTIWDDPESQVPGRIGSIPARNGSNSVVLRYVG
jgi:hypothetical protein